MSGRPAVDMMNQRFGRLLVIAPQTSRQRPGFTPEAQWLCRCDCGVEKVITRRKLLKGVKSCGCLYTENNARLHAERLARKAAAADARTTGALFRTKRERTSEYRAWDSMRQRCYNPKCADYPNYGGRGIAVCKRWRDSFEAFLLDMGRKPAPNLSIDRIDNNGDYRPDNCRWTTTSEQNRNQRRRVR